MAFQLDPAVIGTVAAMPCVREAAQAGAQLVSLWPLTDAMCMDNDAKYAENLQVRMTRAAAAIMTGEDVTVPDAEYVYEGADEIPGRPQEIVDALLAANDAYDAMLSYGEAAAGGAGDADIDGVKEAAAVLGVDWNDVDIAGLLAAFNAVKDADAVDVAADDIAGQLAWRFAVALCVCDELLRETVDGVAVAGGAQQAALRALPVVLLVNELRECCAVPRISLTAEQLNGLIVARVAAGDAGDAVTLTATAEYIAPLAAAEWNRHREDVLWDPDEAKKRAKEEDERKSKEALAAKFAHVKDDPNKPPVEL